VKLSAHREGLPGNGDMMTGSAFLPTHKAGHPADLPVRLKKKTVQKTSRRMSSGVEAAGIWGVP
jgi:hypothetical protein